MGQNSKKAIILIGAQGSGKSTYAKELEKADHNIKRASKDDIRFMAWDTNRYSERYNENNSKFGLWVTQVHLEVIDIILKQGLDVIIDETNGSSILRKGLIEWLKLEHPGVKIEAHYIHRELDGCLRRNALRRPEQIVKDEIIRNFHAMLTRDIGPMDLATQKLLDEGFDDVTIIYK
jgi:predicted kinase